MIKVIDIITFLDKEVINVFGKHHNIEIKYLRSPEYVDEFTLDWINPQRKDKQQIAENSSARVILVDSDIIYSSKIAEQGKVLIQVDNPKISIIKVGNYFFIPKTKPYIHPTAFIHPKAKIAKSVHISPNCSIGNCKIGASTVIYANVVIYDKVTIGNNVIIQAGAVIGTDGLGCERKKDGTLVKFSHLGGVEIGNNVEIGANCQIARGALSNTIIGNGSKLNGLCFIAHNCILGKNVWITGSTMLAGSVKIEDNATIFSKVIIREQCVIGKGATIGMGAVVTKNVPAGETWIGNPAKKKGKTLNK